MLARQLPKPWPLVLPDGFPSCLVGKALEVCEKLHILRLQPAAATAAAATAAEASQWTVDPRGPSALRFFAALTADDSASFASVCDHLVFLMDQVLDGSWIGAEASNVRPMKCCITEQVLRVLHSEEPASPTVDFNRIVFKLQRVDYHQLSVGDRLSLFEALLSCLKRKLLMRKPLLQAHDRLVWWLRCVPGYLLVCQQPRQETSPAAVASESANCLSAHSWVWGCYDARHEQLMAVLQQATSVVDRPRLADAVLRARRHRQLRQPPPQEAPRPVPWCTVKQYLLVKLKSRLVGWAEVLFSFGADPHSGAASRKMSRLRERLIESDKLADLLWCLRYFEALSLPPVCGGRCWLLEAESCATMASLRHLMEQAVMLDASLGDRLRSQRGVCRWCGGTTGSVSKLLFCHSCCHHYHWRCAPAEAPAARGLWLCDGCRRRAPSPARRAPVNNEPTSKRRRPDDNR